MSDGREAVLHVTDRLAIPLSEFEFAFSGSSGPGGQHVNRTATRVTVRFDVARSPSLDDHERLRLRRRLASRLDARGYLSVHCQETRSQARNREIALFRLAALLADALRVRAPRRPTSPPAAAVERRIAAKRRQSERKRSRRLPDDPEGPW